VPIVKSLSKASTIFMVRTRRYDVRREPTTFSHTNMCRMAGGLTSVVTSKRDEVPFASAFPPVADIVTSQEGRYDELIS
jgi:hypothetical protein